MQYQIIADNVKTDYSTIVQGFLMAQDVGDRTLKAYKTNVGYFIEWVRENNVLITSKKQILQYKQHLLDQGKKPSTINAYLTAVRRLFEYMESEGICANVAKYVKSVKTSKEYKKIPLSSDQWLDLRRSLTGDDMLTRRDLLLLGLGVGNGLRTIEMSRLNIEDIQEVNGRTVAMIEGKGSQGGDKKPVILQESVTVLLREYIALISRPTGAIFTSLSNNGDKTTRLTTAGIRYAVKKRFKAVGIDNPMITSHSLRHTHAMELLNAGATVEKIQQSMRHNSIESTMIYLKSRDLYNDPASLMIDVLAYNIAIAKAK